MRIYLFILALVLCLTFVILKINFETNPATIQINFPSDIVAGVIPHHLLAKELIEQFFDALNSASSSFDKIYLLSPDHYQMTKLNNCVFLTDSPYKIFSSLEKEDLMKVDEFSVFKDQGISSPLIFIKKYLPDTQVVPVLISPKTDISQIQLLIKNISKDPSRKLVLASVDFSHYLSKELLLLHDVKSLRVFNNFEETNFPYIDVDSWQALYGVRYYTQLQKAEKIEVLQHKTSFDFIDELPVNALMNKEGGTSYFSILLKKGSGEKLENNSFLFVGDLMMARGVALLTDKYGSDYPFINVKNIFQGIDFVYGNLEGPVVKNAQPVSFQSVSFVYPPEVIKTLSSLGFNILNLANNHTLDKGEKSLMETRNILKEYKIQPLGDYRQCSSDYFFQKDKILFIGADLVYGNYSCVEEIIKEVQKAKKENPSLFIIFTPHWGIEYNSRPSLFQQEVAHELIDKGVDLIVGHHPHVVQAIEEYNGKLIFYSLGNFVFDQYFSKPVQESLVLGIEKTNQSMRIYLIPLSSIKSQLNLMNEEQKRKFLMELSKISSSSLQTLIEDGIIEVEIR